jgi:integrase
MGHVQKRVRNGKTRYRVRYRDLSGRERSRTFVRKLEAEQFLAQTEADKVRGTWFDPNRGRRRFDDWATEWWEMWSSHPHRSPNGLQTTESHMRVHVRPFFGRYELRAVTPSLVQRWQNELIRRLGHSGVMASRSILLRIMDAAVRERRIPSNPVREVEAPKAPVDPEVIFGRVKPRAYTPEDFGRFLASCPAFYRPHFTVQVATGLRPGELLGLRVARLDIAGRYLEVLEVRYEAGKFGSGFKDRPKSTAGIRRMPLSARVLELVLGQLPEDPAPQLLVFPGPGGSNSVPRGARAPADDRQLPARL